VPALYLLAAADGSFISVRESRVRSTGPDYLRFGAVVNGSYDRIFVEGAVYVV
jgi:hypothetical protein